MSGYERSKAPLALMEQIIMILVFALASAVCLQAFVYSDRLSKADEQKQSAMVLAQQVTEYCKSSKGNMDWICDVLNGEVTEGGMRVDDQEKNMTVSLVLTEQSEYLQKARVAVCTFDGEEIYAVDIAYQKGGLL